jgi:hypothetical protein
MDTRLYNSLCFLRLLLFRHEADTMHPLFAKADRLSAEVIGAPRPRAPYDGAWNVGEQ